MRNYKNLLSLIVAGIMCVPIGIFAENTVGINENFQEFTEVFEPKITEEGSGESSTQEEEITEQDAQENTVSLRTSNVETSEIRGDSSQELPEPVKAEEEIIPSDRNAERTAVHALEAATLKQFTQTATQFENNNTNLAVAEAEEAWHNVKNISVALDGQELTQSRSQYLTGKGQFYFGAGGKNNQIVIGKENFAEYKTYSVEISAEGYETAIFTFEYMEEFPPTKTMALTINRPVITKGKILEINVAGDNTATVTELSSFFSTRDLRITIDGNEVPTKNIQIGYGKDRALRITPSEPWAIGEHTVVVKKKDYVPIELKFVVDEIVEVDVISTPTVSPSGEKDFSTTWQVGQRINYDLLAVNISFANGKASRAISYKYLEKDWNVKMSPTNYSELKTIGKQNVTLTIDGFEKQIPIVVTGKKFELLTPWVQLKTDQTEAEKAVIRIAFDKSDGSYQMGLGNLEVKAGTDQDNLKALKKMDWRKEGDYSISGNTIEISKLATKAGKVFVQVSHDEYHTELFEVMVAADEPTEFLEQQQKKSALKQKIEQAEEIDTSGKTDESKAALEKAINDAKTVLSGDDSTSKQLDEALQGLQVAIDWLKDKPNKPEEPSNPSDGNGQNGGNSNTGNNGNSDNTNSGNNSSNTSSRTGGTTYSGVRPDPISLKDATVNQDTVTPTTQSTEQLMTARLSIGSRAYQKIENGKSVHAMLDVAPVIRDGRTMLPARAIAELLGIEVSYDASTKTATFVYVADGKENLIDLTPGKSTMRVNGKETALSASVVQIDGRVVLQLRDIQQALKDLGLAVEMDWASEKKEIVIRW